MIRIFFFMALERRKAAATPEPARLVIEKPSYQRRIVKHRRTWSIMGMNATQTHLARKSFAAVERHTREKRLLDDLTVLVARKLPPLPVTAVAETAAIGV